MSSDSAIAAYCASAPRGTSATPALASSGVVGANATHARDRLQSPHHPHHRNQETER